MKMYVTDLKYTQNPKAKCQKTKQKKKFLSQNSIPKKGEKPLLKTGKAIFQYPIEKIKDKNWNFQLKYGEFFFPNDPTHHLE